MALNLIDPYNQPTTGSVYKPASNENLNSIVEFPELNKPQEVLPQNTSEFQQNYTPQPTQPQQQVDQTVPTPQPPIVDKTDIPTVHKRIEHPLDALTTIADTEEEEFIDNVEAAHGHQ